MNIRNFNKINISVRINKRNDKLFVEELSNDRIVYGLLFNTIKEATSKFNDICAEYKEYIK